MFPFFHLLLTYLLAGGESTAMNRILDSTHNFRADLSRAVNDPNFAVWGTCAGLILMSEKLSPADPRVNPVSFFFLLVS
jgi:glutamine amidotransferase PdxT